MKIIFIFSCSGIFRNVPCSWFPVLSTPGLKPFSIYTLSDLGDLSNLIGTLSRTIQQYSPPSEWIMYELVFFPHFLKEDLLKVDQILWLTFFQARKDFEGFKTAFCHLLLLSFEVDGLFTTPVYSLRGSRFVRASIKPGTGNIPEHSGTFRYIPEHPGTTRNIKKFKKIFMKK